MVDPHSLGVRALNAPAGHAVAAPAADQVTLTAHEVAQGRLLHAGPGIQDLAAELMADNKGHRHIRLRPAIPVIDVQVSTANTSSEHSDQNVVPAHGGDWHVLQPEARLRLRLNQRLHRRAYPTQSAAVYRPSRTPSPGGRQSALMPSAAVADTGLVPAEAERLAGRVG